MISIACKWFTRPSTPMLRNTVKLLWHKNVLPSWSTMMFSVNKFHTSRKLLQNEKQQNVTQQNESPEKKPSRRVFKPKGPIVSLTENAANRILELMSKKPNAKGIKLGVRRRGCNGLSYTMEYVFENEPKGAQIVKDKGVTVYIDPMAEMFVIGTVMDFVENEIEAAFKFKNPNSVGECGCGESFSVDAEKEKLAQQFVQQVTAHHQQ